MRNHGSLLSETFQRNALLRIFRLLVNTMFVLAAPCFAQLETGGIVGTVMDASGAVFPGAQVIIDDMHTGSRVTLTTSGAGTFDAPVLPLGDYRLTATATGFKTLVVSNIHVSVGDRKRVDFRLEPGAVTENVTVSSSAAPLIDTEKADLGNTVTTEKVQDIPLADHSYANLLSIAPGVINFGVLAANGGSSNWFQSAIRIEIDGTDASQVDSDFVGPAYNSNQRLDRGSVDAIQELQIVTGNYNAEYGQSNGAIFNIVTKSGTNDFHGGLFEYFRNNDLDASPDYFGHTNAPLHINQFGGTIGGPIIKTSCSSSPITKESSRRIRLCTALFWIPPPPFAPPLRILNSRTFCRKSPCRMAASPASIPIWDTTTACARRSLPRTTSPSRSIINSRTAIRLARGGMEAPPPRSPHSGSPKARLVTCRASCRMDV
jgi:hypothetical protein